MAANQKQVAISEFFEKNKHFLGFDTLNRALITAVKEAVDNALDACEEARILPDIVVKITKLDNKKTSYNSKLKTMVQAFQEPVLRKCLDNFYSVLDSMPFVNQEVNKVSELPVLSCIHN